MLREKSARPCGTEGAVRKQRQAIPVGSERWWGLVIPPEFEGSRVMVVVGCGRRYRNDCRLTALEAPGCPNLHSAEATPKTSAAIRMRYSLCYFHHSPSFLLTGIFWVPVTSEKAIVMQSRKCSMTEGVFWALLTPPYWTPIISKHQCRDLIISWFGIRKSRPSLAASRDHAVVCARWNEIYSPLLLSVSGLSIRTGTPCCLTRLDANRMGPSHSILIQRCLGVVFLVRLWGGKGYPQIFRVSKPC